MLEDTTRINLLYDFYGNLLTKKQQACLELYYQDDLSLAEIADAVAISRQGVHDLVKRAVRSLEQAEKKLGLVARFSAQLKKMQRLRELLSGCTLPAAVQQEALQIMENLLD